VFPFRERLPSPPGGGGSWFEDAPNALVGPPPEPGPDPGPPEPFVPGPPDAEAEADEEVDPGPAVEDVGDPVVDEEELNICEGVGKNEEGELNENPLGSPPCPPPCPLVCPLVCPPWCPLLCPPCPFVGGGGPPVGEPGYPLDEDRSGPDPHPFEPDEDERPCPSSLVSSLG